jgi:hypothetical protein
LDLLGLPDDLLAEGALPDPVRGIVLSRARSQGVGLAEYVASLLQRTVGPSPQS